jgi:hypothetical protein
MPMRRILEKRNITPEQAVKVLEKNGIKVDVDRAKKILDFMYILAKLATREYFNEDKKV